MKQHGFTLLELAATVAIMVVLMAGSMWALRQHQADARIQQTKMLLATMRVGISAYRYRNGSFPPSAQLFNNADGSGQPIVGGLPAGQPIKEPITGMARNTLNQDFLGGWNYDQTAGTLSVNIATYGVTITYQPVTVVAPGGEYPSLW